MHDIYVELSAFLVRLAVIYLGAYVSDPPAISMTDIDYLVMSDGACRTAVPSARPTYRYSPLLKPLLAPICRWPSFGKLLYSTSDIIFALLSRHITDRKEVVVWFWLLNPLIIGLSTRGSFDSIIQSLLCWGVLELKRDKYFVTGLLIGLCTHLRIYPIIFIPFIFLYTLTHKSSHLSGKYVGVQRACLFCAGTLTAFLVTLFAAMRLDSGYLETGLLYHVTGRVDHRHNLSIFWASQLACSKGQHFFCRPYAKMCQLAILAVIFAKRILTLWRMNITACSTLPSNHEIGYTLLQLLEDLDRACRVFVAFNSVVTSQYFSWSIATLVLTRRSSMDLHAYLKIICFVLSLAISLGVAGLLEFAGHTKYLSIITLANTSMMGSLLFL